VNNITDERLRPYRITGPALINVSGGRTSAFMLRKILDAHNGVLPDDCRATFQNTGLEHPATLEFLREIEQRWCPITWLEYERRDDGHGFKIVNFDTASRTGEPFDQLIGAKRMLPNPVMRFCTGELKIRTGNRFAASLGWEHWTRIVGLRADEPRRVANMKGYTSREDVECPMAVAGHEHRDVLNFWKQQEFDLKLPGGDNSYGNCSLCFLKSKDRTVRIMRANPELADWWVRQEQRQDISATVSANYFRVDRPSYQNLLRLSREQKWLWDEPGDNELPCNCTD